jgi:EmrB/QacA subfamily drug resistance transporter
MAVGAEGTDVHAENPGGARRWWGLVAVSLGVSLIIVDATIVNVAVPSIIRDLGITSSDAQWVQEIYTLVFASLLLVAGGTADRIGRRKVFLTGVAVFTVASVLAAVSRTGPELIGSRLVQGIGGAMVLPTSLSLINASFRGRERGIAFAVWGSTIGGTAALGPLLGGWLTTAFSWRWAFGVNIPLGLLVMTGTLLFVAESRQSGPRRGVDLPGSVLAAVGCAGIVFGLIEGRVYGWWQLQRPFTALGLNLRSGLSPVPVAFAVGGCAVAGFVAVELHRNRAGKAALLDLSLFRIASFRNGNIVAGVVSLGEFGLLFALPLWFQNVLGYSAFETGLALLPLAVGSFAASGVSAPLAGRIGVVNLVRAGIAFELLGVLGIGLVIAPRTSGWTVAPFLLCYGFGVGWATAQITGVTLSDVPVERSGQASGTQSTTRQIGSALGIAVLGTVLFTALGSQLHDRLLRQHLPEAAVRELTALVRDSAGSAIPALAADPRTAAAAVQARAALSQATSYAAFTAAAALGLGLIAAIRLSDNAQHRGASVRQAEQPTGRRT